MVKGTTKQEEVSDEDAEDEQRADTALANGAGDEQADAAASGAEQVAVKQEEEAEDVC